MAGIEWIGDEDEIALGPQRERSARIVRLWLILFVLAVIAGGATWYSLRPTPKIVFHYAGNTVDDPAAVIATADSQFAHYVVNRHGAVSSRSRCYFDQVNPHSQELAPNLYCGPVLFYRGRAPFLYLPYALHAPNPTNNHITLGVAPLPGADRPEAVSTGDLKRPDHRSPPHGADGLVAPGPLQAPANLLVGVHRSDISTLPSAPTGAVVVGRTVTVTLQSLGFVPTYTSDTDTFAAPSNEQLLAFAWALSDGIEGAGAFDEHPSVISLRINGGSKLTLPTTEDTDSGLYSDYVLAVPSNAQSVDLVVTDGDVEQSVSLLTGKPGPNNIALLRQPMRDFTVIVLNDSDATETNQGTHATGRVSVIQNGASLQYFSALGVKHAKGPNGAYLSIYLCLQAPDFVDLAECQDFPASAMTLTPTNGAPVRGTDPDESGNPVFEVSAAFRSGVITIKGPLSLVPSGSTLELATPIRIKVETF